MKLEYLKANGQYYFHQEPGVQDPDKIDGCYIPVCIIKKLLFGRWQIDYYDPYTMVGHSFEAEKKPNTRLVIYPGGVEEIKYNYD